MKIAIYANEITQTGSCGVKTYSLEIIRHLLAIDKENEYILHSKRNISRTILSDRAKFFAYGSESRFWAFLEFGLHIVKEHPDAVFIPIQIFPFFGFSKSNSRIIAAMHDASFIFYAMFFLPISFFPFLGFRRNKPKVVITVHDMAFLLFPRQFTFAKRNLLKLHTRRAIKYADEIIVPSEATKKDILRFYKIDEGRISVIPHGYSASLANMGENRDERVIRATNERPYILFVGSIQPRKNIGYLAEAFARMKDDEKSKDFKLVICGGKGWMHEKIYEQISKNPYNKDIIMTGEVSDDLLASYYRNAYCFVLPSLYEGFGLPVLEAMSFGLPVICGNNSSLSEIVGDAGLLVDTQRIEDLVDKLKTLISSQELKAELSAKSLERVKAFTWEKAAKETIKVIERLKQE